MTKNGISLKGEIMLELARVFVYGQNQGHNAGDFIEKSASRIISEIIKSLPKVEITNYELAKNQREYRNIVIATIKASQ